MRRVVGIGFAVAVACVLAGCGGATISTDAARSALQQAGFPVTVVLLHSELDESDGEIDNIEVTKRGPWLQPSAEVIRYRSSGTATKVYTRAFSPSVLKQGLPAGFDMRNVLTFRICSVILQSYNLRLDPGLTGRVRHAARLLSASCH